MNNFSSEQTTKRWNTRSGEGKSNGSGPGLGPITTLIAGWKFIDRDSVTARRLAAMLWQCGVETSTSATDGVRKWEYYYLRDGVRRERKRCDKMQVLNSKLECDIEKAKLLATECIRDYEKQNRARKSLANVCKEIRAKKDAIMELRAQHAIIREEAENEKKMLQLTEAWREERARMKLVDAASVVQDKYCDLSNLIVEVKAFLGSKNVKDCS